MDLSGDEQLPTLRKSLSGDVARLALAFAAVLGCVSQSQAQQYTYYYPTARSSQPTYYYPQQTYSTQPTTHTTQYYQSPAATQYYQVPATQQYYQPATAPQVNQATESTQTTAEGAQVIPASYTAPSAETPAAQPAQEAPATVSSDPYGFLSWLNSVRASYGLGAVGYDANLSNWASMNNSQQMAYGLGHFVMGPARRQNSAMGAEFPGSMWMASPAHRAALLDPTISWIGIAAAGAYWTFNAY
jgi:hypothetical protein